MVVALVDSYLYRLVFVHVVWAAAGLLAVGVRLVTVLKSWFAVFARNDIDSLALLNNLDCLCLVDCKNVKFVWRRHRQCFLRRKQGSDSPLLVKTIFCLTYVVWSFVFTRYQFVAV